MRSIAIMMQCARSWIPTTILLFSVPHQLALGATDHPLTFESLLNLGGVDLSLGEHVLSVEIVGPNPQATPRHMFGLDYVRLVPVH